MVRSSSFMENVRSKVLVDPGFFCSLIPLDSSVKIHFSSEWTGLYYCFKTCLWILETYKQCDLVIQ